MTIVKRSLVRVNQIARESLYQRGRNMTKLDVRETTDFGASWQNHENMSPFVIEVKYEKLNKVTPPPILHLVFAPDSRTAIEYVSNRVYHALSITNVQFICAIAELGNISVKTGEFVRSISLG